MLLDEVDDRRGKTVTLVALAVCLLLLDDPQGARRTADAAVDSARHLDAWHRGYALIAQALTAPDAETATAVADEAAGLLQRAGDIRAQAWLYGDLGYKALEHGAVDHAHDLIERSLRASAQLDDQVHHTFDIEHMALWALHTGDDAGAAAGLSEALTRCSRYGIRRPIPEALIALAMIAAGHDDAARAAELLGAATSLQVDEHLTCIEERMQSAAMQRARRDLDEQAWNRAYTAGRHRSHEDAIAVGLQTAAEYAPPIDAGT